MVPVIGRQFSNLNRGSVTEGVTRGKAWLKILLYKLSSYCLARDHLNLVRFQLTKVPTEL